MSATETLIVEAELGDNFKVNSYFDERTLYVVRPDKTGGDEVELSPMQYFFVSFGKCIAAVAKMIAIQSGLTDGFLKLTIKGDLSSLEPTDIEIGVNIDADLSIEERKSFLEEVDANLRSISHLIKNKLET